jgi:hypothetical protein
VIQSNQKPQSQYCTSLPHTRDNLKTLHVWTRRAALGAVSNTVAHCWCGRLIDSPLSQDGESGAEQSLVVLSCTVSCPLLVTSILVADSLEQGVVPIMAHSNTDETLCTGSLESETSSCPPHSERFISIPCIESIWAAATSVRCSARRVLNT